MSLLGIFRPVFYVKYVKKHYKLDNSIPEDNEALKQKWNGMIHHIAYYIHSNTDIAILTVFISTKVVSVYNIYSAIIIGMERIVTSVTSGQVGISSRVISST